MVTESEYDHCILYSYEHSKMKPVLRRLEGGARITMGGGKSKIYCKHICKPQCIPLYNYYMLIITIIEKLKKKCGIHTQSSSSQP
jgi:hypothetical protein